MVDIKYTISFILIPRSLKFTRESDQLVHGIPVVKFQLAEDTFSNGTVCPANGCYENNLHTGVLNVTQCKVKSPAFVSRPHFHLADPFYQVLVGIYFE